MGKRRGPSSLLSTIPSHILASFKDGGSKDILANGTSSSSVPDKTKNAKLKPNVAEKFNPQIIGTVPFLDTDETVPEHLKKYFYQRYRYFSKYDDGCLLDDEGWYSVTPEAIATQIAERCRCDTILDAFCGVGGNTIAFAQTCERVIAIDSSPLRLALARHNATIYGVEDRIEFILGDYISFAKSYSSLSNHSSHRKIDVVFLSPPWGGPSYLSNSTQSPTKDSEDPEYNLASITPISGEELFTLTRCITPNIAYFLPRNTNLLQISQLVDSEETVEVEEEWMRSKLKALTCYFGGLAEGQGHMFASTVFDPDEVLLGT